MSRLKIYLLVVGGACAFVLIVQAYQKIDHTLNYLPVEATIIAVESTCYLEQVEEGVRSKTTQTTDSLPCSKAEVLHANHPAYTGFTVKGDVEISFEFTSPADQSVHQGSLTYDYQEYPKLAQLHKGSELPVLANKHEPAKVTQDYDQLDSLFTP